MSCPRMPIQMSGLLSPPSFFHLLLVVCVSTFLAISGSVNAQSVSTVSLPQALDYALQNYVDARKSKLDQENIQYQLDEVEARALPQVSVAAGLAYNPLLQKSALPGELNPVEPGVPLLVAFGQKWNANAGISLSQTLFDQGLFTGIKAARSSKEFYEINSQLTGENIIEQVTASYYQIFVQRQKVTNIDSTISTTDRTLNILNGLYQSGLAKKIDVDRIEVQLANLKSQRQQLLNELNQYENLLKFYMGMPVESVIVLKDMDMDVAELASVTSSDPVLFSNRTEMMLLQKQAELLSYKKQSIKAEYYPSLSLTGNLSLQGLGNVFPLFKGPQNGANWFEVSGIGLNLRVPIFNGNATRARVRQSEIEIKKVREDMVHLHKGLSLEHSNAVTQIQNSLIILTNQERNEKLAEDVLDNTRHNYTQGLATLTELIEAENALFQARNAYSTGLLNFKLAELKLLKSKGQLRSLLIP